MDKIIEDSFTKAINLSKKRQKRNCCRIIRNLIKNYQKETKAESEDENLDKEDEIEIFNTKKQELKHFENKNTSGII